MIGYDLDPNLQVCTRCIYDERVASIFFNEEGICNYCIQLEELTMSYQPGGTKGISKFSEIIDQIKADGKGKKYDCVIGISGGTDSSFMVHQAVTQWGLRPLAVHYDNTWNSAISTQNIARILNPLGVDLYTHVVNNKEADDIFRAFFKASVAELDASTDLAFAEVMNRAAWKNGVKYALEGHSFITEGITPVGRNYFDGKYIAEIHKKFGTLKMSTYPLMTFERFLFWSIFARIRKIRPFWYIDYNKETARKTLEDLYGWKYYGGHHLENRITSYAHSVYLPSKFNTDMRNNTLSAKVRNHELKRNDAWNTYSSAPEFDEDIVDYFQKRIQITQTEYENVMNETPKSWMDYPTYKRRFELLRPLFSVLADAELVPRSFYLKYCFPTK